MKKQYHHFSNYLDPFIDMPKGKWGQVRKKTPLPQDENDNKKDDEMQLEFTGKMKPPTSTVKTNSKDNASVPSTTKVMKECNGSISTSLTSNKTENLNSRVGSTVLVGILKKENLIHIIC